MDWRKVVFLEGSFSALSAKQRVVSGFCLGIAFSLLVFFLLSYGSSPVSDNMFSSPSSLFPWFFSAPDLASDSDIGSRSPSRNDSAQVGSFAAAVTADSTGLEKTRDGNSSGGPGDGNVPYLDRDSTEAFENFNNTGQTHGSKSTTSPYIGTESGSKRIHAGGSSDGAKNAPTSSEKTQHEDLSTSPSNRKDSSVEVTHYRDSMGYPQNSPILDGTQDAEHSRDNGNDSLSSATSALSEQSNGGYFSKDNAKSSDGGQEILEKSHILKNVTKDDLSLRSIEKKDGVEDKDAKELEFNQEGKNASHESSKGMASEAPNIAKVSDSGKSKGELSENCDIFDGRWVRDEETPYYPPNTCPYIDMDFNCHQNGRPDEDFLKWRWQPYRCNIPRLNGTDFLERLRGQRLLFVGDSLNRNMWESLVCILHHSVKQKKRVYEVSGKSNFKTRGYYSFRFEDYKCNIDFVRSPFLVRELFLQNVNGSEDEKLRLDLLDETTAAYHGANIVVFNTGHWWTHEKTSRGVDYYQEGNYVHPVLNVLEAYEKGLNTWARWVDKNINSKKTRVFFRGYSLTHFRGGQWNSGGQCHKETEPIFNETYLEKYPEKMQVLEKVLNQMKTPVVYLNVSKMTDYRKDGHPSIYRKVYKSVAEQIAAEKTQDCSHWCLPGIPDTWNELLYASLLIEGKGSWKR